jgi:hypothetical protein
MSSGQKGKRKSSQLSQSCLKRHLINLYLIIYIYIYNIKARIASAQDFRPSLTESNL